VTSFGSVGGTIDKEELALVQRELGENCSDKYAFLKIVNADNIRGMVTDFSGLSNRVDSKMARNRAHVFVNCFLFMTFMVFVNGSSWAIFYLQCDSFPDAQSGQQSFLSGDYSISCLSIHYKSNLMLCYAMLAVYLIGIPLMYWVLLYSRRSILRDREAFALEEGMGSPNIGHLSFLISGYKPEMCYFEVR
jgi:hypothetical protein